MFRRYCDMFQSSIFLILSLFFVHLVQNNASNLNQNEILESLRPLKYIKFKSHSETCSKYCGTIACQPIKECNDGVILKNETYCGCCEACVKFLDVGEECTDIIKGTLALGAQRRCKSGTTCKRGRCELNKEEKSCLQQHDVRQKHVDTGNYESELWIPQCDEEGFYVAKQKKITRSVCFDKSGKKIFGSADDLLDKTCSCSRLIEDKRLKDPLSFHIIPHEHCSSSGSFDVLQCIDNLCYCADMNTGDIKSELVRIDFLQNLDCFDERIHSEDYLKDCEKELQRTKKLAYEFWEKGVKIYGIDQVVCDPDGTYSPKQCLPDRCVCSDKKGRGIGNYQAELAKAKNYSMSCYCARDDNSAHFQTLSCENYGNYKPYTCFVDNCVCVDEDGESIKPKNLKGKEKEINAYCDKLIKSLSEYPKNEYKSSTLDDGDITIDTGSFTDDYEYTDDYDDDN